MSPDDRTPHREDGIANANWLLSPRRYDRNVLYRGSRLNARLNRSLGPKMSGRSISAGWRELPPSPRSPLYKENSARPPPAGSARVVRARVAETIAALGIDLGLTAFAALSEGACIAPLKALACQQVRLRRYQRSVSRKKKGSANRRKAVARLATLHRRIARQRNDWLHKLGTELADRHPVIALEDLHVRNMSASAQGTAAAAGKPEGRLGRDIRPSGQGGCQAHRSNVPPHPFGATSGCKAPGAGSSHCLSMPGWVGPMREAEPADGPLVRRCFGFALASICTRDGCPFVCALLFALGVLVLRTTRFAGPAQAAGSVTATGGPCT